MVTIQAKQKFSSQVHLSKVTVYIYKTNPNTQNTLSTSKYPFANSSFNSQQAQMFKASTLDKNKKSRKEKKNQNITQEIIFSKEKKRKPKQIIKHEETQ